LAGQLHSTVNAERGFKYSFIKELLGWQTNPTGDANLGRIVD